MKYDNKFINTAKIITLAVVLSFGVQFASAQWAAPTQNPPQANTPAPLNVGSAGQVKDGGLTLGFTMPAGTASPALTIPTGRVSIGAGTAPGGRLHLKGTGVQNLIVESSDAVAAMLKLNIGSGPGQQWHLQTYKDTVNGMIQPGFQIVESGQKNRLVLEPGGNAGMGVNDPRVEFHLDRFAAGNVAMRISSDSAENSSLQLYDSPTGSSPNTGWAILKAEGTGDLLINRDTRENEGTRTDLKILRSNGQIFIGDNPAADTVQLIVNGKVSIKGGNPVANAVLTSDGTGGAASWVAGSSSDRNLKKNIESIGSSSLSKILKLAGVSFNWKNSSDSETRIGFIAQDVENVFPEVVYTNEDGLKSVDYDKLVAPLVEAVKSQQAQIEELKAEVEQLKNK